MADDILTSGSNGPAPLYVVVQGKAGHKKMVVHPSLNAVTSVEWQQWRVPLSDLASGGVNLATVKSLLIGVGDRANPAPAAGRLYLDDIGVGHPVSVARASAASAGAGFAALLAVTSFALDTWDQVKWETSVADNTRSSECGRFRLIPGGLVSKMQGCRGGRSLWPCK